MKSFSLLVLIFISSSLAGLIAQDIPHSSYTHYVIDFVIDNGQKIPKTQNDAAASNITLVEKRGVADTINPRSRLYLIKINNKQYTYFKRFIIDGKRFKILSNPSEVEVNYDNEAKRLLVVVKSDKEVQYYFKEVEKPVAKKGTK